MKTRILVGTHSLIGISQEPFIELTGPSIKSNRWNKYISMSTLGVDRYKTRDYNHDVRPLVENNANDFMNEDQTGITDEARKDNFLSCWCNP